MKSEIKKLNQPIRMAPTGKTMLRRLRSHLPYFAVLFLPVLIYHGKILVGGEIIQGGDLVNQFVPWREFALREWREGRFPGWNP
ncbi:MAG TPA: hypothetical protein PK360_16960, partial [bacterium]|nr:hypothetical protein [bacterium]